MLLARNRVSLRDVHIKQNAKKNCVSNYDFTDCLDGCSSGDYEGFELHCRISCNTGSSIQAREARRFASIWFVLIYFHVVCTYLLPYYPYLFAPLFVFFFFLSLLLGLLLGASESVIFNACRILFYSFLALHDWYF